MKIMFYIYGEHLQFTANTCNEPIRLSEFVSVNIKGKGGFGLYIVTN